MSKKFISADHVQRYLNDCGAGHLKVGKRMGEGGMASVFELKGTKPPKVIKVMDSTVLAEGDPKERVPADFLCDHFRDEIKYMKKLKGHPNIMPIEADYEWIVPAERGLARKKSSVFMAVMPELVPLEDYVKEKKGLTEKEAVHLAIDICKALQHCEDHEVLHRDLKPGNIFVDKTDGKIVFVLGDFGICRMFHKGSRRNITRIGTPGFLAPELERPDKFCDDPRGKYNSDIYSLGAMLYFLMSEKSVPPDAEYAMGFSGRELHNISGEFERIIMKAVSYYPEKRYQHARDMQADLQQLLPPKDDVKVIPDDRFKWAKEMLLNGKYGEAMQIATFGKGLGDVDCARLVEYLNFREVLKRYSTGDRELTPVEKRARNMALKPIAERLDELYYNENDLTAKVIGALVHLSCDEVEEFYKDMKCAAQKGSVLASFFYGRALYAGWFGQKENQRAGSIYVLKAAEKGYLPALQFVKQYLVNSRFRSLIPVAVQELVEHDLPDAQVMENIIKFL